MGQGRIVDLAVSARYPYPIAVGWQRVVLASTDQARLEQIAAFQECLLRTLVTLLIPDYLGGPPEPRVEVLIGRIDRPTARTWLALLRAILSVLRERAAPGAFMPESIAWFFDENGELTDAARSLVAVVDGHPGVEPSADETLTDDLIRMARDQVALYRDLLDGLGWLPRYLIFRVLTRRKRIGGVVGGTWQVFAGTEELPGPLPVSWTAHLSEDAVYLAGPAAERILRISPFIQMLSGSVGSTVRMYSFKRTLRAADIVLCNELTRSEVTAGVQSQDGTLSFDVWLAHRDANDERHTNEDPTGGLGRAEAVPASRSGELLDDRFDVEGVVGMGPRAQVFRVRDLWFDERVALKVFRPRLSKEPEHVAAFQDLGRLLQNLRHPGVIDVIDTGRLKDGRLFIKYPLVSGGSLADRIDGSPLAQEEILVIARQLLSALAYLHDRHVVHGAVRPSNCLVDAEEHVLLTDIAVPRPGGSAEVRAGIRILRDRFAAPERRGDEPPTAAGDMYGLARTLHELAVGRPADGEPGRGVEAPLGELLGWLGSVDSGSRPSASDALAKVVDAQAACSEAGRTREEAVSIPVSPAEAGADDMPERIGAYEVIRRLGRGAMGDVFLVKNSGERGFVSYRALKQLRLGLSRDHAFVSALIREARIGGLLRHQNLVQIHELLRIDNSYVLTMEFVDGVNLSEILVASRVTCQPIDPRAALELTAQVADGLHFAHNLRDPEGNSIPLVHHDLKPSNVRVSRDGAVKVMDFGIARLGGEESVTGPGGQQTVASAVRYMAPEQARGERGVGPSADVYTLGALLYELLVLVPLCPQREVLECLQAVQRGDLDERLEHLPAETVALLRNALRRDPAKRFQTARGFSDAAREVAEVFPRGLPFPRQAEGLVDLVHAWREGGGGSEIRSPLRTQENTPPPAGAVAAIGGGEGGGAGDPLESTSAARRASSPAEPAGARALLVAAAILAVPGLILVITIVILAIVLWSKIR